MANTFTRLYGTGQFGLSFELFPPKTPASQEELFSHLGELMRFEPDFVTCTYGAGGSTRDKTLEIVEQVARQFGCPVASHLTCVGSTVDELRSYLTEARRRGVRNIVALRGDPPQGQTTFTPVAGGLSYANELVELIRREFADFGVAVAGYPEVHREAPNADADLANLARKVAAGADVVVTQLFYDNHDFFEFRERYRAAGIKAPLVPGILPITSLAQIRRITSLCGARLPETLVAGLETCQDDAQRQFEVGVEFAIRQVRELLEEGVPGLHFYVLNKSPATCRVLQATGRPR
jgi:methylenetetrahydrofolate reductase (NADPH)